MKSVGGDPSGARIESEGSGREGGSWLGWLVGLCVIVVLAVGCDGDGLGSGPDRHSEIVRLDLDAGLGSMWDSDGSGTFMTIRDHTNWWSAWDQLALGHFASNSRTDLAFLESSSGDVGVYTSNVDGVMSQAAYFSAALPGMTTLISGDFTSSAFADLLAADLSAGSASIQRMLSGGLVEAKAYDNWYTGWDDVSAGEFAAGERDDLFLIDYDGGIMSVQQNDGTGVWTQTDYSGSFGTNWDDHTVGDFNGDGNDDVVVVDYSAGDAEIWTSAPSGTLSLWQSYTNWYSGWDLISAGEFGGDQYDDLLLVDRGILGVADFADTYEIDAATGALSLLGRTDDWGTNYDGVVVTGDRDPAAVTFQDPAAFTREAFHIGRVTWPAEVPMVGVLTEEEGGANSTLNLAGVTDLLFTNSSQNAADYFDVITDGAFTLVPADSGAIGPFEFPSGSDVFEIRRKMVDEMADAGFPFASFDTNNDNKVTNDELVIMLLVATPTAGDQNGANRTFYENNNPPCYPPDGAGVDLCLDVPSSSQSFFPTTVHEIAHTFGARDLYAEGQPAATCRNLYMALMSCASPIVHHDPWHNLDNDWEHARSYRLNGPGTCLALDPQDAATSDVVILWDPERGTEEYFVVETRRPMGYDAGMTTIGATTSGIAVWRVRVDSDGIPLYRASVIERGPNNTLDTPLDPRDFTQINKIFEGADHILDSVPVGDDVVKRAWQVTAVGVNPYSTPGNPGRPFTSADGVFQLEWTDHTDTGFEFKAGAPDASGAVELAWYVDDLDDAPTSGPAGGCFQRVGS